MIAELRESFAVGSVGIAAAGTVDSDRSTVRFAPNVAWRDHRLGDRLASRVGLPVVVENDANAAGWAEHRFGAGRGSRVMLMMTVGTGIGGALVVDSRLVRGANGFAAEVGHIGLEPDGPPVAAATAGAGSSTRRVLPWPAQPGQPPRDRRRLHAPCSTEPAASPPQ
jgi:glucokinase